MSDQVMSALMAFIAGGLLAVVLFVPFVFVNYRRYGRLSGSRALLWIAFLVYAMALWTYTLLPLPDPNDIQCTQVQLHPFQFIDDIRQYQTSPRALIHNPAFIQVALNVLLFMPLGFFMRTLWRRGLLVATLTGFAISLLIETTQVTGVWGIYPCAYRVFDVDDLLANTSGALLGAVAAAVLVALRERLFPVHHSPAATRAVTTGRRLTAMVCDLLSMVLLGVVAGVASNAYQVFAMDRSVPEMDTHLTEQVNLWAPFVLLGLLALATGRTVGDHAVRLRYADSSGRTNLLRAGLRYLAGIGGFQLLDLLAPADLVFLVLSIVAIFITKDRGGLPSLLSGTTLQDDTAFATTRAIP